MTQLSSYPNIVQMAWCVDHIIEQVRHQHFGAIGIEIDHPATELRAVYNTLRMCNVVMPEVSHPYIAQLRDVQSIQLGVYYYALLTELLSDFKVVGEELRMEDTNRLVVLATPISPASLGRGVFVFTSHPIQAPVDTLWRPMSPKITLSGLNGMRQRLLEHHAG